MNIKALITTLVLGSSSVAMAHPITVSSYDGAPMVRDHRTQDPAPSSLHSPPFIPAWVTLGTESQVVSGSMSFRVNPRLGNGFASGFSTLRLQSTSGKSLINRVEVRFANGGTQIVKLDKYLTASSPTITIDLDGDRRAIRNVTVIGRNARQSAFSLQAM